jgi:hypothetical protein
VNGARNLRAARPRARSHRGMLPAQASALEAQRDAGTTALAPPQPNIGIEPARVGAAIATALLSVQGGSRRSAERETRAGSIRASCASRDSQTSMIWILGRFAAGHRIAARISDEWTCDRTPRTCHRRPDRPRCASVARTSPAVDRQRLRSRAGPGGAARAARRSGSGARRPSSARGMAPGRRSGCR